MHAIAGWPGHWGSSETVHFLGYHDDIRECFASSDFFVMPTYYDPCSLVVLEALACGLPVITTVQNGASELYQRRPGGLHPDLTRCAGRAEGGARSHDRRQPAQGHVRPGSPTRRRADLRPPRGGAHQGLPGGGRVPEQPRRAWQAWRLQAARGSFQGRQESPALNHRSGGCNQPF